MKKLDNISVVGFDLDGTLYPLTSKIKDKIKDEYAKKILIKIPALKNLKSARQYFDERYAELKSDVRVFEGAGYDKLPLLAIEDAQMNSGMLDEIEPNPDLCKLLGNGCGYDYFLLTSCPEELALEKLKRIGLDDDIFFLKIFGDSELGRKRDGSSFDIALDEIKKIHGPIRNDEVAYFGDRLKQDILPAKQRGMKTVAVGSEIPEADISIHSINDLKYIF